VLAIVLSVIRVVTCRRRAKFCTSVAQVSHGFRHHPSDLSGGEVFGLDDPLLRLVSSLIHDFFRIAPNRENLRQTSTIIPPFMSFLVRSVEPRVFRASRETFRIASVCGHGNASASLNVRFHYYVTTNHSCDKSTRFGKSASIMRKTERTILST